jgi:hypothetical protein
MRAPALIGVALALAGCQSIPKPIQPPKVVEVVVEKLVPVPEELTRDCGTATKQDNSVAEAVRLANTRDELLKECTSRMRRIRNLAP